MTESNDNSVTASRFDRALLTLVDALIAALILVLPFLLGGRQAWGHWFLITAALALGGAWSVYAALSGQRYRLLWMELFLVAGLAIAWIQVQPQPADQLATYSSEYERLLPAWQETQQAGTTAAAALNETQSDTAAESTPNTVGWQTLSLTPAETKYAWWVFLAYSIILVVVFQRLRHAEDCYRLLKLVGLAGVAMTAFGLLQWGSSNGRFFWFYKHPFTDTTIHLKGAFTNRNHFAQFLTLCVGPLMWWLFRDIRQFLARDPNAKAATALQKSSTTSREQKRSGRKRSGGGRGNITFQQPGLQVPAGLSILLTAAGLVLLVVGILSSFSRGGMLACAAALLIALVGLWRGFKPGGAMAAVLLGGGLAGFGLLALTDQDQLQLKLDQLLSAEADQIDTGGNRRAVWNADAKVIRRFPLFGTGVGSHREVYTLYMDNYADFALAEMTHAESSFVHAALETGLVGVGCLILGLVVLLLRLVVGIFRTGDDGARTCVVAVLASAAAACLHAVVDFIWYVPGIVVVSLVLAAVGLKAAGRSRSSVEGGGLPFPRIAWAGVGGLCVLGLVQIQPQLLNRITAEREWHAALLLREPVRLDGPHQELSAGDALMVDEEEASLSPEEEARYEAERDAEFERAKIRYIAQRIEHLHRSLQAVPTQHRIRLALASDLIQMFNLLQMKSENPFPLKMLCDTVRSAQFDSTAEMNDWLQRTCGQRIQLIHQADALLRESLSHCPVQGHAYITLLETNFLNDPDDHQHQQLVDQAMLVRGHDPRIQLVAGYEAILRQDPERGLKLWNSVFHSNQRFRQNIVRLAAPSRPAEFFLHHFQPSAIELQDVLVIYEKLQRARDVAVLLRALCGSIPEAVQDIDDEDQHRDLLLAGYDYARRLEDLPLSTTFLEQAIQEFPFDFKPRYLLGMTLIELERPEEALELLQWCYDHDPSHIYVPKLIHQARRQILKRERLTQL